MGRWSRRLAPLLIEFGGLADGDRVLDVGCGTASLSYALAEAANVAAVIGVDQAEVFLDYARKRSTDPRSTFRLADARALPFAGGSFDRAYSMLALQFIPDVEHAVAEDYASFDEYWRPLESRDSPPGLYVATLSESARATLREHVRRGFLCNRPDGPRSFASTAWACRGTVPR